ncbi:MULTISPECIES: hypothetical protein [unclassified Bartonella]|uniref:hypothetical protein n=1 Tax=unclassified Bartonella TaxID=2645622 RepID=UPI0035CEBCAC
MNSAQIKEKKYELTDETIEVGGYITLYCILALRDFGDVKAGDLGAFIQKEDNLGHDGNCWISDDAKVYGYAKVFGDAHVYGNARVFANAQVFGGTFISGKAKIYDSPLISIRANIRWLLNKRKMASPRK